MKNTPITTYAGYFNYTKFDLPMVRMVSEEVEELRDVVKDLQDHSTENQNPISSYHISVYTDGKKTSEMPLKNFKF